MTAQDRAERAAEGEVLVKDPWDQRLVGVVPHLLVEDPDELLLRRERHAVEGERWFVLWRLAAFRHLRHADPPVPGAGLRRQAYANSADDAPEGTANLAKCGWQT